MWYTQIMYYLQIAWSYVCLLRSTACFRINGIYSLLAHISMHWTIVCGCNPNRFRSVSLSHDDEANVCLCSDLTPPGVSQKCHTALLRHSPANKGDLQIVISSEAQICQKNNTFLLQMTAYLHFCHCVRNKMFFKKHIYIH